MAMKKTKKVRTPGELTFAQKQALTYFPEDQRAAAQAKMIEDNLKAEAHRKTNREVFSISLNENNNSVIRGLGNAMPLGLRLDSLKVLVDNIEAIKAFLETHKALIGVRKA